MEIVDKRQTNTHLDYSFADLNRDLLESFVADFSWFLVTGLPWLLP